MFRVKRIHTFILQTFLPLLVMTFAICWFIVLMQFLWKYVDEMVGKGLSMAVLGEMVFYAALSLVPMSLPLAILFASLMTFGNLGERLELLAIKSAGISLMRLMRPLIVLMSLVSVGSFFFQDAVMPVSQVKLWSLMMSMRMKSPELDIPEKTFFNEIQGYNLYVREKNPQTGLLKDLMIYDNSAGFNNVMVILADSGRLKMADNKLFLLLTLYNGEAFQNLKRQSSPATAAQPVAYRRETFATKEILIEFDANFNRTDESYYQNQYIGKSINSLSLFVDSVSLILDSVRLINAEAIYRTSYKRSVPNVIDRRAVDSIAMAPFDSIVAQQLEQSRGSILSRAKGVFEGYKADYFFRGATLDQDSIKVRRHMMEWHTRFTLAFGCVVFFFIGAPLGAIIRKGGFGMPVILSVLIFIAYYNVNTIGSKMARDAVWPVWEGMWLSSAVFAAIGIFLTWKAINDSAILNSDTYIEVFKRIIGKRELRNIIWKEVVIYNPDYATLPDRLEALAAEAGSYLKRHRRFPGYISYWKRGGQEPEAEQISERMEAIVEELGNSSHILVLNKLMDYPIIGALTPLGLQMGRRTAMALGAMILPTGLPLYFIALYRRKLLRQDLKAIKKVSQELKEMIEAIPKTDPQ
ncbi:MAG: LptF/LptG family permease [Tannerellaceae bacterium]|jgi:lipopolysaccharide export system permease protein|nr:LptF/LptG family permease [Tannerellaceae bacterium]